MILSVYSFFPPKRLSLNSSIQFMDTLIYNNFVNNFHRWAVFIDAMK